MKAWWHSGEPGTREEPWLHPAVVLYLDALIQPHWSILEHGSGGSTRWFAQRAKHVVAVEANPQWRAATAEQVDSEVVNFWEGSLQSLIAAMPNRFDLLLIDGQREERPEWCFAAEKLVRPGGIVVLDNANRHEYGVARTILQHTAKHFITFETNPPGFTQAVTDMYRMKGGAHHESWV